ncbi:MAG: hypothetical protein US28_C0046G0006 [Candidatus Daviesbacteria bacterium GW2011_GWA1_36_8]|uniref:Lysylphosphatidylglycerol synthetase/UPF0104 n=1 Tax=Candidatus Daviesbacteria bacterium GW2011_GWA1_36_8 TaxID=1618417 RepID=A0A0G0ICB5_9BACT|nr:MAG: hypothetical protein US28_C0046G0006 [Candidatus Daviesbacteria bacterium GW2011_GWA1_36_8]
MKKKLLFILLNLLLLVIWIRIIDLNAFLNSFKGTEYVYIIISTFLGIITSLIISFRQKILIKSAGKNISVFFLWSRGFITSIASILLPFFSGGLLIAFLIAQKTKLKYLTVFSLLIIDFLLGLTISFFFAAIATIKWGIDNPLVLIGFGGLVLFFITVVIFTNRDKFKNIVKFNSKTIFKISSLTIVIFILGMIQSYLYFVAFNLHIDLIDFILATSVFGILGLLPGLPFKLGQYEFMGVISYVFLLGLNKDVVSAVLLTQHLVSITVSFAVGLLFVNLLGINLKKLRRVSNNKMVAS